MDIKEAVAIYTQRNNERELEGFEASDDDLLLWEIAEGILADAYLATLREDDGEPLPEGRDNGNGNTWRVWDDGIGWPEWHIAIATSSGSLVKLTQRHQPTRGQLRKLLEVLGVGDA
jgi:hypothetical protein